MTKPRVYIEACPIIDMAKHKAGRALNADPTTQQSRENCVWFCRRILQASVKGDMDVLTSFVTIAECTHLQDSVNPVPKEPTREFLTRLLTSGKGGIRLVQASLSIMTAARDLRWKHNLTFRSIDSIHVASALHMKCEEFYTTDGGIYAKKDELAKRGLNVMLASSSVLLPLKYRQDVIEFEEDSQQD